MIRYFNDGSKGVCNMEEIQVDDLVVPLYEDSIEVFRVSSTGGAISVITEHGYSISHRSNYRLATQDEIDTLYVAYPDL